MSGAVAAHAAHLLPGFVIGALAPNERREVLAHLAECPACRAELAAWTAIQEALREPPQPTPAADTVLHAVWRRVDASSQERLPWRDAHRNGNGRTPHGLHGAVTQPAWSAAQIAPPSALVPPAAAASRRRWPAASVASALLAVVLVLGTFALGPGRALLAQLLPRANVLTLEAPGLAGAESEETLVELTLPGSMVPVGERVRSCLSHIVIPPHARSTWEAKAAVCCPGTRLNYVLRGTYAVWPEGPVQIIRADRTAEDAPAGSELLLNAGDTIVLRSDTPYAADNPGETPAELLQYILAYPPDFPRGTATLAGWDELDYDMPDIPLQGGPASVSLHRIVLGPEAILTGPPGVALMQVTMPKDHGADAGPPQPVVSSGISPALESEIKNHGRAPVTVYVLALEPAGITLMP